MSMDAISKKQIEQFVSIVDKIVTSRFVQNTKTVGYTLNFTAGQPIEQDVKGFDENDLRSMLMDLRKLTLKRDGVNFPDICDLLVANSSDATTISNVRQCKALWSEVMEKPPVKMVIGDETESGEGMMKKWLYGHYFHEDRANELQELGLIEQFHKANFVIAMTDLVKIAAITANNAKVLLGLK